MKKKIIVFLAIVLVVAIICGCSACKRKPVAAVEYMLQFDVDGVVTTASTVNGAVQLPTVPQKEGYIFTGWYVLQDEQEVLFEELYPDGEIIDKDLYLIAKWRPETSYRLTFIVEEGIELASWDIDNGVITQSLPIPIREGYDFLGWCTTANVNYFFDAQKVMRHDMTVYAKWIEIGSTEKPTRVITLRYGHGITDGVVEIDSGSVMPMQDIPVCVGYTFKAFTVDSSGEYEYATNMRVTSDFVLYAQWQQESRLSVTFDTNGGSDITPYSVLYNATIFTPEPPKKDTFRFVGWSKFNDDLSPVWFEFGVERITRDVVLYAIWEPEPHVVYNVTFVKNNGEESETIVFEDTAIVFPDVHKDNCRLIGWFMDETFTQPYALPSTDYTFSVYACWSETVQQDGFVANLVSDLTGYRIEGYDGIAIEMRIPELLEGLPVVEISESAFRDNAYIQSLHIPASVKTIGDYAFAGCTYLQTIDFGAQSMLKDIGSYAFYQTGITNLILGSSIERIHNAAFSETALVNLVIYADVQMDDYAFASNSQLQYVSAPNLTALGMHAFAYCPSLQTVTISNVSSIDTAAFAGCSSLSTISLPNCIALGSLSFEECVQLGQVNCPKVQTIGSNCFSGDSQLCSIDFPSIVSIGQQSFASCVNLQHVGLGSTLQSLDLLSFSDCIVVSFEIIGDGGDYYTIDGSLVCGNTLMAAGNINNGEYHIPNECINVDNSAFANGSAIKRLYIGAQLISMGEMCAMTLTSIQRVYVDDNNPIYSVDERGSLYVGSKLIRYADHELDATYTMDQRIVSIGMCAFTGCKYLREIVLSDTYTVIDMAAFYQCYSLRTVSNAQNVAEIEAYAFYECSQLSSIDIGDNVTIGEDAFRRTKITR